MEKIHFHDVPGVHNVGVYCLDDRDANFCHHRYGIDYLNREDCRHIDQLIQFQQGPVKEKGINGLTIEALLTVCSHRLMFLQAGPLACSENDVAVKNINKAIEVLKGRTERRLKQQIESTIAEEPKDEQLKRCEQPEAAA